MDSHQDIAPTSDNFARDFAILDWMVELGVDEAICENSVDRYSLDPAPQVVKPRGIQATTSPKTEPVRDAPNLSVSIAAQCHNLADLQNAIAAFEGCALKQGARNTVFADGNAAARVMIIGAPPSRDDDRSGKPFSGPAGQLLDKMLAAIGLSRNAENAAQAVYITNIIPWRPPQNREASKQEVAMMEPFLMRHIELAKPEFLLLMGNPATKTLLKTDTGVSRMRGNWGKVSGIPALPMIHPSNLLRTPAQKRGAWADLLSLKQHLAGE